MIETLIDCANALGELLPRDHPYRMIVERANRIIEGYDLSIEKDAQRWRKVRDILTRDPCAHMGVQERVVYRLLRYHYDGLCMSTLDAAVDRSLEEEK